MSVNNVDEITEEPSVAVPDRFNSRDRNKVIHSLLQSYDLRLRQMIERNTNDPGLLQEAQAIGGRLSALGVDSSWLSMERVADRINQLHRFEARHDQEQIDRFYDQLELSTSSITGGTQETSVEERNLAAQKVLELHFQQGNSRLQEQGFLAERFTQRYLAFDSSAMEGFQEMIRISMEELLRNGITEEDAIVLVGERVFHNGALFSVVHGVLASGYIEREVGGVIVPYSKILDEIQNCRVRDVNGRQLSTYEMVGVLHTHPLEPDANGRLLMPSELSPEDIQVLKAFDSFAPGFIIGSITPGIAERSGNVVHDIRYWNREADKALPINPLRVI